MMKRVLMHKISLAKAVLADNPRNGRVDKTALSRHASALDG
jgi:hypothetical protein